MSEIVLNDASKPYIKLTKNTKGFTWDIKVEGHNIELLEKLQNEMESKFGSSI